MASLSLKHVYKVYPNGAKAVNDFNMQIDDKEFIVFVGPSGCGKSTTLRMIAGLEEITAGELKIGDVVVNDVEPKDRDIAMVFQNYALYPHMTIYENIAFSLQLRKIPDVKRDANGQPVLDKEGNPIKIMRKYTKQELSAKVHEAATILGITEYLGRKPKEMSGGQRQRVALGRAIVREPKVMLLDEPLSNLDAKLRTQMRSEIVKLHKKLNTTFIYVTHDQVEAMTMGTRIVVMKDGYIKQIDTPKNLYKYPNNKFVAGFIGTPQMNFFDGTLTKEGDNVNVAFSNANTAITVPYAVLRKATPDYLDGSKPVCIGFRAEDVTLDAETVAKSTAKIKVKISHWEELGTETLVYGDINLNADGFAESPTRIIIKATGFQEFQPDTICEAAINVEALHLFDAQTEENVMPRIPVQNFVDCEVKGGQMSFLGNTIQLPPAIKCDDGNGQLLIPPNAINFEGKIKAKVLACENINGQILVTLNVNGGILYALAQSELEGNVNIGLDCKKLIIKVGNTAITPMPQVNGMRGTFAKEKVVEVVNGKKVKTTRYCLVVADTKLHAPAVAPKIIAAMDGRSAYNSTFRYEWSPYDISIAENGIKAQVSEVLNYGDEMFVKCAVLDETVYVKGTAQVGETIYLCPNVDKVGVIETGRQIKIV